jgi:ribosomal protein S18 acetylase RimI-like enzyme
VVQVRRAVPEDAAAIAAVHVGTWQVAYRGLMADEVLDGLSVAKREHSWREALSADKESAVYVAGEDGAVVGFCAVAAPSRDDDAAAGTAEIAAIYVHPDAWRTGVGRALMDVALRDLRAGGWRRVTLWVLAENHQARDFYARFGFEPDGAEWMPDHSAEKHIRLRGLIVS